MREVLSPNFGYPTGRVGRNGHEVKYIVLHVTEGINSENWTSNPASQVSYNYIVKLNGEILVIVKENNAPYSNGVVRKPSIRLDNNVNPNLLTISIAREGYARNKPTEAQIESIVKLCKSICDRYDIDTKNIIGHKDIDSVQRANCPSMNIEEIRKEVDKISDSWEKEMLDNAINELHKKGLIKNPGEHKDPFEKVEAWLFFEMIRRISDG